MFNFFSKLKNSSSSLIILDTIPFSLILRSEIDILSTKSISPNLLGIGSPWGSILGYFRYLSRLSINSSDDTCSSSSAIS